MFIVLVIVTERLGQCAASFYIDVEQGADQICDLIHRRVDLIVPIVLKVHAANLNALSNFIRRKGVDRREFLR